MKINGLLSYPDALERARHLLYEYMPMEDKHWKVFSKGIKVRHLDKDEFIIREGEVERYLSIVLEGCTRHFLIAKGEDISFDFSFQYEFNCSYASFIQQSPSRFFIQALKPTTLASIPHTYLMHLYEANPISNKFGRTAVEQYYIFREEREIGLLTQSASERYRRLLDKYPVYVEEIPLKYLATYLNIKPESLSRIRRAERKNRKAS